MKAIAASMSNVNAIYVRFSFFNGQHNSINIRQFVGTCSDLAKSRKQQDHVNTVINYDATSIKLD